MVVTACAASQPASQLLDPALGLHGVHTMVHWCLTGAHRTDERTDGRTDRPDETLGPSVCALEAHAKPNNVLEERPEPNRKFEIILVSIQVNFRFKLGTRRKRGIIRECKYPSHL